MLENLLKSAIRDVADFPKAGIMFKDITPILQQPQLSNDVSTELVQHWQEEGIEGVVGIESRGFIFGMQLAQRLNVPFIPVRKAGKLPYDTLSYSYDLEYGSATVEVHIDAILPGQRILIHDDLLATGGTAQAAAELVKLSKGTVAGFSFLVELGFLKGSDLLSHYQAPSKSIVLY